MRQIVLTHEQFDGLSQAVLEAGGCLRFEAHGFSMHPLLKNNDVITVRPADNCELTPGAIVLCRSAHNGLMVHRIAENDKRDSPADSLLLIRGDASPEGAQLVSKDDVLGIISHVERGANAFRMDRGPWLLLGRIVARHGSLVRWIVAPGKLVRRTASRLIRRVQGLAVYRSILHGIAAHNVRYGVRTRALPEKGSGQFPYSSAIQGLSLQTVLAALDARFGKVYVISALLGKRQIGRVEVTDRFGGLERNSGWWLIDLMVRPLWRGAGIGEQLVRRATELAVNEGAARLNVLVNAANQPALALYARLGFQDGPEPLHSITMAAIFPDGNPELKVMSLALTCAQAGV